MKKRKFPKPIVIGEISMITINGDTWGFELSILSEEEQEAIKKESIFDLDVKKEERK